MAQAPAWRCNKLAGSPKHPMLPKLSDAFGAGTYWLLGVVVPLPRMLARSPPRMTAYMFMVLGILINLHFPLLLGGGTTQVIAIYDLYHL